MNIKIRKALKEDQKYLEALFNTVVEFAFLQEGLVDMSNAIFDEIHEKYNHLKEYYDSNGEIRTFYVAEIEDQIVGTAEICPVSELINSCTENKLASLYELASVFVFPEYHGNGIASKLISVVIEDLKSRGEEMFCLDSGYATAQKIWVKKFGEPQYIVKNYWGEGADHYIWHISL
ncbi:MAG: GNAT family N-acetyltransferase [Clostridia bacterium]|nr:GNAT family N-acetyltransferase [Clostridia bacterium]